VAELVAVYAKQSKDCTIMLSTNDVGVGILRSVFDNIQSD